MKLRKLEPKDSSLMLEWMHDESVVKYLAKDFSKMTEEDCKQFIEASRNDVYNEHYAIVDENDQYMGTVSLKSILNGSAEFAITMCAGAMGKGVAIMAMEQMLNRGFEELELKYIYWYVSHKNERALRFYDKNAFSRINKTFLEIKVGNKMEVAGDFVWYLEECTKRK